MFSLQESTVARHTVWLGSIIQNMKNRVFTWRTRIVILDFVGDLFFIFDFITTFDNSRKTTPHRDAIITLLKTRKYSFFGYFEVYFNVKKNTYDNYIGSIVTNK